MDILLKYAIKILATSWLTVIKVAQITEREITMSGDTSEFPNKLPRKPIGWREEYSDFTGSIIFYMIFPLLPLLFESINTGTHPSIQSLTITASIYSFSIGVSSRDKANFCLGIFCGFILAYLYGKVSEPKVIIYTWYYVVTVILLAVIFIFHLLERFNKHVVECEPVFSFKFTRGM